MGRVPAEQQTAEQGAAGRQPQQERSRATRGRLLAAAVTCLAELGWSGTTVALVAERAGVSRGAAQHHFPTREDLVTGAIEHISDVRDADLRQARQALPTGRQRTEAVLNVLVGLYRGEPFRAALQLWVAAATDAALRARVGPLESRLGRHAHQVAVELLGADESRPGVRETVQATRDMARGLGLADLLGDDTARRGRVLHQWARLLDATLASNDRKATDQ